MHSVRLAYMWSNAGWWFNHLPLEKNWNGMQWQYIYIRMTVDNSGWIVEHWLSLWLLCRIDSHEWWKSAVAHDQVCNVHMRCVFVSVQLHAFTSMRLLYHLHIQLHTAQYSSRTCRSFFCVDRRRHNRPSISEPRMETSLLWVDRPACERKRPHSNAEWKTTSKLPETNALRSRWECFQFVRKTNHPTGLGINWTHEIFLIE